MIVGAVVDLREVGYVGDLALPAPQLTMVIVDRLTFRYQNCGRLHAKI
jgi:hypothetical protein